MHFENEIKAQWFHVEIQSNQKYHAALNYLSTHWSCDKLHQMQRTKIWIVFVILNSNDEYPQHVTFNLNLNGMVSFVHKDQYYIFTDLACGGHVNEKIHQK